MKILLYFFLFLITVNTYSQETKIDTIKRKEQSKIQIGFYFSPDYCYRTLKTKDASPANLESINYRNSSEIYCVGFTAGMNFCYSLNKRFTLETGLAIANNRYQTNEFPLNWGATILGPPSSALYVYNHYYAEIPLKLNATLGSRKFRWNAGFGIIPGIFLHYTSTFDVFDSNNKLTQSKVKTYSGFNIMKVSLVASIGCSYHFNKRSSIRLEPTYRYGMIKTKNAPIHEYLWSMGLNIGYQISL